jgi:hypothetical protein
MSVRVGKYYLLLQGKLADTVLVLSAQEPETGA